jgi:FKBP-type peptidyl-prolyl cis-trans isomerase SlyD
MTESQVTIANDIVVGLDYVLKLEDGDVVDSSDDRNPLEFLQGHGEIVPGLEQALYGMAVGDEKRVVVEPADGYGEVDPVAIRSVPRDTFPPDLELTPGKALQMRDQQGEVFTAYVEDVRPDGVVLDFNHPLAGETLYFDVRVTTLRTATDEELNHGHVHER